MGLRLAQQTTTITMTMSTIVVAIITERASQISELPLPIRFEEREPSADVPLELSFIEEDVSLEDDDDLLVLLRFFPLFFVATGSGFSVNEVRNYNSFTR